MKRALVWIRNDLRIKDNPALKKACDAADEVIPVFFWHPEEEGDWAPGSASRSWLHHSLKEFKKSLDAVGLQLIIRQDKSVEGLKKLVKEVGAEGVFWNRRYEPFAVNRDRQLASKLKAEEINVEICHGNLLFEPNAVSTNEGKPYQVFTPFWKSCLSSDKRIKSVGKPKKNKTPSKIKSDSLDDLNLLPDIDWDEDFYETWTPGEEGAWKRFRTFLKESCQDYNDKRDRPDLDGTSRLSPHLHFGEISSRSIWEEVVKKFGEEQSEKKNSGPETFLREIGWREFAHHLLYHFPKTTDEPLRDKFSDFPWNENKAFLKAWQKGETGYPFVDAGMRQLWKTGWMHNRVRMVAGSFLVKHLLLPWQKGEKWFWDTLVDGDLASNTLGWQWVAGCGADAAPYFRVFNPTTQGEKFDPDGTYIRKWIPELEKLPDQYIHTPTEAPDDVLKEAGIELDEDYPRPIVDHKQAREKALEAFEEIK